MESAGITRVAGSGESGFGGDGGPAIGARLSFPSGAAVDEAGNLYIADTFNHCIRKVGADGGIAAIAGPGRCGCNGAAAAARQVSPAGVAARGGAVYIADPLNHCVWKACVWKVDPAGAMTAVAGSGESGFDGDGGPAAAARLNRPCGVAADGAGNLYVADCCNDRIRRIDRERKIATVAGNGKYGFAGDGGAAVEARLDRPRGAAVDEAGNLYIADTANHRIRRVDPAGTISTVAGTGEYGFGGDEGAAVRARLASPWGVAVDAAGNLYIADTSNRRVRRVDLAGKIATVAGPEICGLNGSAAAGQPLSPAGIAAAGGGSVYIADDLNHCILRLGAGGKSSTCARTTAAASAWASPAAWTPAR